MNCREFLARHSEYLDERIEPADAERLRSHAASCASCARYDRIVRRGAELARDLLPRVEVSDDFAPRLRHRLFHARDDMARARAGATSLYAAAASVILVAGAAAAFALVADPVPVVDSPLVWASAPPAMSPLHEGAIAVASTAVLPMASAAPAIATVAAEADAHDAHVVTAAGWPVYSRPAVAAAFPAGYTRLVVTPADFRQPTAQRAPAGPLLIRH